MELRTPVRYRFAKKIKGGGYRVSSTFKGIGGNFSANGAAIMVGKPLPEKTLVYLEIYFTYQQEPVLVTAEVVRKEEVSYKGKMTPMIMVRYLVIDEAVRDRMTGFIISRGKTASN